MKSFAIIFSILPLLAFASPVPEAEAEAAPIEKRAVTCALTGSDVRYHTQPNAASSAPGQFGAAGTRVSFSCYTTGSSVDGDTLWNKVASGKGAGYYVSDHYISTSCSNSITTHC